jgi:hypothetical protein
MMSLFGAPGGKALWKERSYLFGEEFRRYIENDLMIRPPHPMRNRSAHSVLASGTND